MEESHLLLININLSALDTNHNATSSLVPAGMKGETCRCMQLNLRLQPLRANYKNSKILLYDSPGTEERETSTSAAHHHHRVTVHLNSVSSLSLLNVSFSDSEVNRIGSA